MTAASVAERFRDSKQVTSGYEARCPCHDDNRRSLSIGDGEDGRVLLHCHAGCTTEDIVRAVGLKMTDLMPSNGNGKPATSTIVTTYDYVDEAGKLLYQSLRYEPKNFKQRSPDGNGGWKWTTKGIRRVLYRLPELLRSESTVYVCEGEKDVDRLITEGLAATTNVGGAGKWLTDYAAFLRGRRVVVVPDNDEAGRKHAEQVATSLVGVAESVRVIRLPNVPDKGDVSNWLDGLGDSALPDELLAAMAEAAGEWQPQRVEKSTEPEAHEPDRIPEIMSLATLASKYPTMRPPVVDGLLRRGETANIIAETKVRKSWLTYGLAFSVATGAEWLDTFPCQQGRVLVIDNELHPETIADRFTKRVLSAMGVTCEHVSDWINVVSLRGLGYDIHDLHRILKTIEAGHYSLVVADAWYRFFPAGVRENENSQVMLLYNRIDEYTRKLDAAWINVHHSSKGPQDAKSVVDVGSGAGAQARAPDSHIILRPHEEDGVFVLEAAVRSFPPVEPMAIRWDFPLWRRADGEDPKRLKRPASGREERQRVEDEEGMRQIVAAMFGRGGKGTAKQLRELTGMGKDRMERLLGKMQADGRLVRTEIVQRGNPCGEYSLSPIEDSDDDF